MIKNKIKKPTDIKENTGRVFIDLGKLMFGSFILGGVLRGEAPQYLILLAGFVGAVGFIITGILFVAKERE
jgi:hypothetical protein